MFYQEKRKEKKLECTKIKYDQTITIKNNNKTATTAKKKVGNVLTKHILSLKWYEIYIKQKNKSNMLVEYFVNLKYSRNLLYQLIMRKNYNF